MCGIIGYSGKQQALSLLIGGLYRLEYRGYDSAGIALQDGPFLWFQKRAGKVAQLDEVIRDQQIPSSTTGIAHTRWATHGLKTDLNAHPHLSCDRRIALVHNGQIHNHNALRDKLVERGHHFASMTDTEVLVHLIEEFRKGGGSLVTAVQKMHELVEGAYGILVMDSREPGTLVAASNGSPLLVGIADDGVFVASDIPAFRPFTDRYKPLTDGEMVELRGDGTVRFLTLQNTAIDKEELIVPWDLEAAEKGGFEHFMLKEIFEQPAVLADGTLAGRIILDGDDAPRVHLGGFTVIEDFVKNKMERVLVTACGTSWHAGLIFRRMGEKLFGLANPISVEYASEFARSHTPVDEKTLCIVISQSGETKDTLDAAKRAKRLGATVWNVGNVVGSSMTRIADSGVYLHVGPEIGVASTKAFTAQVAALALTAVRIVELRAPQHVPMETRLVILEELRMLPLMIQAVLNRADQVRTIAQKFSGVKHALFLGSGYNYPAALEGALKLKEISYIHAEGYPGGEMKHGPIALIDENMPVVIIATRVAEDDETYTAIMNNLEQVAANKGRIILIASEGDESPAQLQRSGKVEEILYIPRTLAMFTPVLAGIYCQLLAYDIAKILDREIDKPRNLAKSVTVD